jgi:hypothetical protein
MSFEIIKVVPGPWAWMVGLEIEKVKNTCDVL